jgi:hypothetical protein
MILGNSPYFQHSTLSSKLVDLEFILFRSTHMEFLIGEWMGERVGV